MNSAYFHDHIDPHQRWQFTQIDVSREFTPYYRLYTGGANRRFLLGSHNHTLYWGRVTSDYYNVDLLRHFQPWPRSRMPIRPITSADIETFKTTIPDNPMQYWANFYAQALIKSPASILHQGQWRIAEGLTDLKPLLHDSYWRQQTWRICDYQFDYQNEAYIDIFYEKSLDNPLPLKAIPNIDDGRVKWWRKKIKEQACPPMLLWWQRHLLGHIVIDGHSRWLAHQLEGSRPDVLVISAFKSDEYKSLDDPQRRIQVLQSLKKFVTNNHASNYVVTMDKINEVLLQTYPNTMDHRAVTVGKPIMDLDSRWVGEIKALFNSKNTPLTKEDLEIMLDSDF